jgi:hypothetical protein
MSSQTIKEEARRLVEQLPEDATWEDLGIPLSFVQSRRSGTSKTTQKTVEWLSFPRFLH